MPWSCLCLVWRLEEVAAGGAADGGGWFLKLELKFIFLNDSLSPRLEKFSLKKCKKITRSI